MQKVMICDAIMGTGKTTAAINYMNDHRDRKFIFITKYLDEVQRVKKACSLVEPRKMSEYHGSKTQHTLALMEQGRSFVTTHQAFKYYTDEHIRLIKEQEYTIIIDEAVDVLNEADIHLDDLVAAEKAGFLEVDERGRYRRSELPYSGTVFRDILRMAESNYIDLVNNGTTILFWAIPPELLMAASEVFVLTYLFSSQDLCNMLEIHGIEYEYIGVDENMRFCSGPSYKPAYLADLRHKIHIIDSDKINAVGDGRTALSKTWFANNSDGAEVVKKNVVNFFMHYVDAPADQRMWSTHTCCRNRLKGGGYTKGFVTFNEKATNDYRHKTALAYCINVYTHVSKKLYFYQYGIDVDDDAYALSTMIQWIWRSAIRDGKEITVYVPSKRMRTLLVDWVEEVSASA